MLKFYTKETLLSFTNPRKGEVKFGQTAGTVASFEALKTASQHYVLLGIPEDIGVRANYGNPGASKAWEAALASICNIQQTHYCEANNVIVLGEVACLKQMEEAASVNPLDERYTEKLGDLVLQVDTVVAQIIEKIVACGKIPIVIGGGHNNSFGNLKGASKALENALHCINFDAHTDFRALEHRHSGNGFSYAKRKGFLDKYFIFGLHRNYTPKVVFDSMANDSDTIHFSFFEDISVAIKKTFTEALQEAEAFCTQQPFALEIDLDAVANMGSSAMTPSGFSLEECRRFVQYFSTKKMCTYIHICEGAPNRELFPGQVGKAIAYLVSDVISNVEKDIER